VKERLAFARVLGETSPLLILVGYSNSMKFDMFRRVHGVAARHDV
jgi:ABC-type phosphate transport system permease subunit